MSPQRNSPCAKNEMTNILLDFMSGCDMYSHSHKSRNSQMTQAVACLNLWTEYI